MPPHPNAPPVSPPILALLAVLSWLIFPPAILCDPTAQPPFCTQLLAALLDPQTPPPLWPPDSGEPPNCAALLASNPGQAALRRCASDPHCMSRLVPPAPSPSALTPSLPPTTQLSTQLSAQACDALSAAVLQNAGQCSAMALDLRDAFVLWSRTQDPSAHPPASPECAASLTSYAFTAALLDCLPDPAVQEALRHTPSDPPTRP